MQPIFIDLQLIIIYMPNFLIVDDHSIIICAIKTIIGDFLPYSSFDEACDGDTGFRKIKANNYDLVILDINMPNTDSFGLVNNILALKPGTKILIFSMNSEEVYAKRYFRMGVMGYIKKDALPVEIENAITTVLKNKKYVSTRLRQLSIENLCEGTVSENPFHTLSTREFEIVQHLVRGESSSEICKKLKVHSSTIGTHKAKIFAKLKCSNIIDLNLLAKMHNINTIS